MFKMDHSGDTLLRATLESRAWRDSLASSDYVFVVREVTQIDELRGHLSENWPGSSTVTLSRVSGGALLSVIAGAALVAADEPIVVDLADIMFEGPEPFWRDWPNGVGGAVPCFESDDPAFSYVRIEHGRVVEAAEKRVISNLASAGAYFYRDGATLLDAAAHSIRHRANLALNNALFVCPSMNGVLEGGLEVVAPLVWGVRPIGKLFHARA